MDNQELVKIMREMLQDELAPIKEVLEEHGQILNEHGKLIDSLTDKINRTQEDVQSIKCDIVEIKDELDLLEKVSLNNWNEILRMKRNDSKSKQLNTYELEARHSGADEFSLLFDDGKTEEYETLMSKTNDE